VIDGRIDPDGGRGSARRRLEFTPSLDDGGHGGRPGDGVISFWSTRRGTSRTPSMSPAKSGAEEPTARLSAKLGDLLLKWTRCRHFAIDRIY
jgi:hypothetical protein